MDSIKQQHQRQAKRESDLGHHCCCQRSRKLKYNAKFLGNQKVAQVRATGSLNYATFFVVEYNCTVQSLALNEYMLCFLSSPMSPAVIDPSLKRLLTKF